MRRSLPMLLQVSLLAACGLAPLRMAQAVIPNGRLQIIHLDVKQGDGAVLISPLGQVVMIDDGVNNNPTPACAVKVPDQLVALGVTHVDHHFSSHYHSDHIGLFASNLFGPGGIATLDYGWDRAGSYNTGVYTSYVGAIGDRRRTLVKGQVITLDSLSAHPVTITCVDLAGAGTGTGDENSLSLVLKVSYGEFDEVFGGDLQGSGPDVESIVGPEVGPVEVYKVHHHGSATSSNVNWLNATQPKIGVISVGNPNGYGHPRVEALTRLHAAGVHTYWTEAGSGAPPDPLWDKVSNNQVVISATWEPGGVDTVRGTGFADTFTNSGSADLTAPVVSVAAPNGGEDWKAGSSHLVTWTATDNVGVTSVDLAYSTNGGASFPNEIAAGIENTGSHPWIVPNAPGSAVRVRATAHDAAGNLGADSSAANFAISTWTITASGGPGGSVVPSGAVPVVEGGSQHFSIAPAAGNRVATLTVDGDPVTPDTTYTFEAVTADHVLAAAFEDATTPVVHVTSPAGGERWNLGSVQSVTWTAADDAGVDSINVDYSVAGPDGPWLPVAHGLANSGSVPWTLPGSTSDSALVRVTAFDPALNQGWDASDSLFHIVDPNAAVDGEGPAVLALSRPQPNPGPGATVLRFSLPAAGRARLEIMDLAGRRLWRQEAQLGAGAHAVRWNGCIASGERAGAGLYFVRLVTPWGTRTQRLALLR